MKNKKFPVDFTRAPFKGLLSEVARELEITPQAVHQAVKIGVNTKILNLVRIKINERKTIIKLYNRAVAN